MFPSMLPHENVFVIPSDSVLGKSPSNYALSLLSFSLLSLRALKGYPYFTVLTSTLGLQTPQKDLLKVKQTSPKTKASSICMTTEGRETAQG